MNRRELFYLLQSPIDKNAMLEAKQRWDNISKPIDGLGDYEGLIIKISGILGNLAVSNVKKALIIMCADNGIVEEGVSQCGQENTYLVAKLLGENRSTASIMAKYAKAEVVTVDIGINCCETPSGVRDMKIMPGTNNFLKKPAMSENEAILAISYGMELVNECKQKGFNLILTGEMGIGNTTTATALLSAITGLDSETLTGRGAGLSDEGLARKKHVISEGLKMHKLTIVNKYNKSTNCCDSMQPYCCSNNDNIADKEYVLRALCCVGGLDIAGLVGLYLGGAVYGVPIVVDGLISAVAALVSSVFLGSAVNYMIPSHSGRERGVGFILDLLGLTPLINGNMALGEGTGALMLMPLLDMTLDFYRNAGTFSSGNIDKYVRLGG